MRLRGTAVLLLMALVASGCGGVEDQTEAPRTAVVDAGQAAEAAPVQEAESPVQPADGKPVQEEKPPAAESEPQAPATPTAPDKPTEQAADKSEVPPAETIPPQPQEVSFRIVSITELPASLQNWGRMTHDEPGLAAEVAGDLLYLKVYAGERRTGGYSVEIQRVEVGPDSVKVQAVLYKPAPGAIVTQALTYPKVLARVDYQGGVTPRVEVEWTERVR